MTKVDEVLETISSLTVLELSELLTQFEEKFGVTAAPVAVAAAAPSAGGEAPSADGEEEAGGTVELVLTDVGPEKIKIIKEIRTFLDVGLKEAKDLVEGTPTSLLKDAPAKEAQAAKEALEALGAKVEIK